MTEKQIYQTGIEHVKTLAKELGGQYLPCYMGQSWKSYSRASVGIKLPADADAVGAVSLCQERGFTPKIETANHRGRVTIFFPRLAPEEEPDVNRSRTPA